MSVQPRGYRLLDKVPRLTEDVVDELVGRFGTLQKLMRATTEDLASTDDVDTGLAHTIKEGLARQAETALLDRFH